MAPVKDCARKRARPANVARMAVNKYNVYGDPSHELLGEHQFLCSQLSSLLTLKTMAMERALRSPTFARSEHLRAFLHVVCDAN